MTIFVFAMYVSAYFREVLDEVFRCSDHWSVFTNFIVVKFLLLIYGGRSVFFSRSSVPLLRCVGGGCNGCFLLHTVARRVCVWSVV